VVDLAREAKSLEIGPADVFEWMPLLEAYVNLGNIEKAKEVSRLIRDDKNLFTIMCSQYEAIKDQPAEYDRVSVYEALCKK
jgi:hypothetical protein